MPDLKRDGIAPGEVTKAYLPDVTTSTSPRLIANGLISPISDKETRLFFEFGSTQGTKWPKPILGTTQPSALCIIMDKLSFQTTVGSRTARAGLIHTAGILKETAASFHSCSMAKFITHAPLTAVKGNGVRQPTITPKIRSGDFVFTKSLYPVILCGLVLKKRMTEDHKELRNHRKCISPPAVCVCCY